MKKYLLLLSVSLNTYAYKGSIEVQRYYDTHFPAQVDYTGPNVNYGVKLMNDFSLWDFATKSLPDGRLLLGAEGYAHKLFTQGGGVVGFELKWDKVDLGVHHRSIHNFDYDGGKFLNQNYLSLKYKWGDGK